MQAIDKLNRWTSNHDRGYLVDVIRVIFGVFLLFKGIAFAQDPELAADLVWPSSEFAVPMLVGHLVVMTHLCGGLLLIFGLLTRIVTGILLPILAVAVVVQLSGVIDVAVLIQTVVSLALCAAFLVLGPGKGSADRSLDMHM